MKDPSLSTNITTTSSTSSAFLTSLTTSSSTPPLLQGQAKVGLKLNTNFHDRSGELETLRERLRGWVKEKGEKDGWSEERRREVGIWLSDIGVCWRGLRRALYDQDKAFQIVSDSLSTLLTHSLLSPTIPSFPPFTSPPTPTSPPIFTILPYPTFSDPLDRPIAVITLRCLQRDFSKDVKEKLKGWSYWCAEIMRRCLWDVDERRRGRGKEGEEVRGSGCVLVIDVKNAGFKNIDLDLLPHMLPILQSYYPGLFSTIYIVNASWTHASMWGVMKRLLPKTTLDRIRFLEKGETGQVFDLERLPKAYGGKCGWDIGDEKKGEGEAWERYSWGSWEEALERIHGKGKGVKEEVNRVEFPLRKDNDSALEDESESGSEEGVEESDEEERTERLKGFELHLSPSRARNTSLPPLESPSMAQAVASVGLQRHSISSIRPVVITPARPPLGRLSLDSNARSYSASLQEHHARRLSETTVEAERRMARQRLLKEEEDMAKAREEARDRRGSSADRRNGTAGGDGVKRRRFMIEQDDSDDDVSIGDSPTRSRSRRGNSTGTVSSDLAERRRSSGLPISAYDKMMNPMFGYPAVSLPSQPQQLQVPSPPSPSSSFTSYGTNTTGSTFNNAPIPGLVTFTTVPRNVVPLHGRRRKRDLAKTLFLLSIVRLVGLRDWFTSLLSEMGRLMWGLLVLRKWWSNMSTPSGSPSHARGRTGMYARGRENIPLTPEAGFRSQMDPFSTPVSNCGGAQLKRTPSGRVVRGNALVSQDDWLWLLLSLLVVRGSWGRALVSVWEGLRTAVRAVSGGKLAHG